MQQNDREEQEQETGRQAIEQPNQEVEPTAAPMEERIEEERRRADSYLDLLQRTQADFVNYRRRAGQERSEERLIAQSVLLSQLLPVLDDLERALQSAPPEISAQPWGQGLTLIARRLTTLLNQLGVRQIGAPGEPFDTHWHEAIMTEPRADVPEGTILSVTQPGYALRERLIRPAQVSVAGAPPSSNDAPVQPENSKS